MNNKGFTLMELLAVIIILALLSLLVGTSVTSVLRNSKLKLYDTQIKLIETAVDAWKSDNIYKLPEPGNCAYITLGDLKAYGLLEENLNNPKTNEPFSNEMIIKIRKTEVSTLYGTSIVLYELDATDISECTDIYPES